MKDHRPCHSTTRRIRRRRRFAGASLAFCAATAAYSGIPSTVAAFSTLSSHSCVPSIPTSTNKNAVHTRNINHPNNHRRSWNGQPLGASTIDASTANNNNNINKYAPPPPPQQPSSPPQNKPKSSSSHSQAAQWHRDRRQAMLQKYGDQIAPLERSANSQWVGGLLLAAGNLVLASLAVTCGRLSSFKWTFGLALFPGSLLSLWQLQILHDNLHGSLLDKSKQSFSIPIPLLGGNVAIKKKRLQQAILFWGSMPSIFGYYLYLQYGHLSHHQAVGNPKTANLRKLFDSPQPYFEDGDVLFVAHRMRLLGGKDGIGPRFIVKGKEVILSIANLGFQQWRYQGNDHDDDHDDDTQTNENDNNHQNSSAADTTISNGSSSKQTLQAVWNMNMFAISFLYERMLLVVNDCVVALTGKNFFFLNKPKQFHKECAKYCRLACLVRGALWWAGGKSWHSLLFLYLAETLWSIPPHPAAAMFVTNHGSRPNHDNNSVDEPLIASSPPEACLPSSSTYAGPWYSAMTLGTNYHCEHHDFPTIPFHRLGELRKVAPEFYRTAAASSRTTSTTNTRRDNLWKIMRQAFAKPDYYACMNDLESVR